MYADAVNTGELTCDSFAAEDLWRNNGDGFGLSWKRNAPG